MAQKAFCINELVYSQHITKRRSYEIVDSKEDQIRIKSNKGKLVWLPSHCFTEDRIPEITSIDIDDEIDDPENDVVEVTISFDSGEKRWVTFSTIQWLYQLLDENTDYVLGTGFIILKEMNRKNIEIAISDLDKQHKLIEVSQKL